MVLANEQVAEYLADRRLPTLYRVHERPEPRAVAFLCEQLASLDVPTPPVPDHMTPQQAADVVSGGVPRSWPASRAGARRSGCSCCARSSRPTTRPEPRPRRARQPQLLPLHVADPALSRTWSRTARCSRGSASTTRPTPAHELDEAGVLSSASERDAMQTERAADDVCLAFLLERRLADADASRTFEGEVVGLIEKGAFVRFGDEGFEGLLPVRRLPAGGRSTSWAPRSRPRARGAACASATRSRWRSTGSRPRAGASISRRQLHTRSSAWRRSASARRRPATWRPTARPRSASTCSRRFEAGHRAPGLRGQVAAQRRRAAQGRLRRGARRRGVAAQHAHRALRARAREPRPRAPAQAAAAPARDRAPDRQDGREGADARAHAGLLQRAARQGRAGARARARRCTTSAGSIKERDTKREIERALSERYELAEL